MAEKLNPIHAALSRLAVLGLRVLSAVVTIAPPALWGAAATVLAPVLWHLIGRYRKVTLQNLADAGRTPAEARRIGKASFRSNLLVLFESLAMPRLLARKGIRVEDRIAPEAQEIVDRIRSGEEPLVFAVAGHTGVWEFNGAEIARRVSPTPVVVSARLVRNPILRDFLVKLRNSFGIVLVEKDEFLRYVIKHHKRKEARLHVFLCDQHFKGGEKVPFIGRNACTVAIPATLSRRFKVPILIGRCVRRRPGDYVNHIEFLDQTPFEGMSDEEAVRGITAAINRYIGDAIAEAPEQWTWGHRRWRPCCGE